MKHLAGDKTRKQVIHYGLRSVAQEKKPAVLSQIQTTKFDGEDCQLYPRAQKPSLQIQSQSQGQGLRFKIPKPDTGTISFMPSNPVQNLGHRNVFQGTIRVTPERQFPALRFRKTILMRRIIISFLSPEWVSPTAPHCPYFSVFLFNSNF